MIESDNWVIETFDYYRKRLTRMNVANPAQVAPVLVLCDLIHAWLTTIPEEDEKKAS